MYVYLRHFEAAKTEYALFEFSSREIVLPLITIKQKHGIYFSKHLYYFDFDYLNLIPI